MFCNYCGKEIKEINKFCPNCGATIFQSENTASNKNKSKFGLGLIVGIASMVLLSSIFILLSKVTIGNNADSDSLVSNLINNSNKTYEGNGYSSPEKVADAYMRYLIDQDVDGMISCYAIETYCENHDFNKHISDIGAFSPRSYSIVPVFGDYTKDIFKIKRLSSIYTFIYNQYLFLAAPKIDEKYPGMIISLSKEYDNDVDEMLNDLFDYHNDNQMKSKYEYRGKFIDSREIIDNYEEKSLKIISRIQQELGAQEVECVNVEFEFDGTEYLLCLEASNFNGRWYLTNAQSFTGSYLGISSISGGIIKKADID